MSTARHSSSSSVFIDETDDDEERGALSDNEDAASAGDARELPVPRWPQSFRTSMDYYANSPPVSFLSPRAGESLPTSSPFHRFRTPSLGRRDNSLEGDRSPINTTPLLDSFHEQHAKPDGSALPPLPKPPKSPKPPRSPKPPTKAKPAPEPEDDDVSAADYYYDSLEEEEHPQGSSFTQALFNGMNILAGVGVLSTPYALQQGGWLGLSILLLVAVVCCYTGVLLKDCLESAPHLSTYPDIGEFAFGRSGRFIISCLFYFEIYACTVEFLILEGDNLSLLFPWAGCNLFGMEMTTKHFLVLLSALFVLPTVYLRDLRVLSYISAAGVAAAVVVVGTVIWIGAIDGVGFSHSGRLISWQTLPVSVGLYGFCYSGHAVFPNIYNSMRNKSQFTMVLVVSFFLCTLIYGGMAIAGYLMFGDEVESQITLNLPAEHLVSKVAVWTTVVNPFTKYALCITPVASALEELLPMRADSASFRTVSIAIRTALVASTVTVAISVPFFGYVMALIGSFLSMTVSVILPCACFLKITGKRARRWQIVVCFIIMSLGLIGAVVGTYSAVGSIAGSWKDPSTPSPPAVL